MANNTFILPQSSHEDKVGLFIETLLNETDSVSKVSPNSALSGIASGISRLSGLIEKDIAIYYSKLHPDYSYGSDLDALSNIFGLPGRFQSSPSSTYILIIAEEGTTYDPSVHKFISSDGFVFDLILPITVDNNGYVYAEVKCQSVGEQTNVPSFSINSMNSEPIGHLSVVNEVAATGGRDIEQDELFRRRIKEGVNVLATNTLSMLEQRCMFYNNNILKLIHQGINDNGKVLIKVLTQNGVKLTTSELNYMSTNVSQFASLTDYRVFNKENNVLKFENADFYPIDIEIRADFDGSVGYDDIRSEIQLLINNYIDFRNWESGDNIVEWDNLLELVKSVKGIKYVKDQYFYPKNDLLIPENMFPRLRGLKIMDINGTIISSGQYASYIPVFYSNDMDRNLAQLMQ